jgi:hypothetical protein
MPGLVDCLRQSFGRHSTYYSTVKLKDLCDVTDRAAGGDKRLQLGGDGCLCAGDPLVSCDDGAFLGDSRAFGAGLGAGDA